MMGLNILPEKDCNKSHPLQPSHSKVSTICRCLTAQNQPDTSSAVPPDATLTLQQQQFPPRCHSSVRFMGQRDGVSCESMSLSNRQECLPPKATPAGPVLTPASSSAWHKQCDPAFQELSRQDDEQILQYLPSVTGIEMQSLPTVSLLCMDDLRIRQCLSPLKPCTSATKHQTVLNQANRGDNVHPQSSLHGRLWLTENPESVHFPLAFTSHLKTESARETVSDGKQDVTELKSNTRKRKQSNKRGDTAEDAVAPNRKKRMYTGHLQDAASLPAYKDARATDGKRAHINLSVCSVSLSTNNVLAKERKIATSSLNISSGFIGKSDQPSTVLERLAEKPKQSPVNSNQTRIRTRGFMKKAQESPSNISSQKSAPMPVCTSEIVNNGQAFPRRKPGRPPKSVVKELIPPHSSPTVAEKSSDSGILPKEVSKEGDKTNRRYIKKKTSVTTAVEAQTVRTECTKAKPDANNNNNIIPAVRKVGTLKQRRMVCLKEFQKLIQLQHWKTRKSKEIQETNGTGPDAESGGIDNGDGARKESSEKNHNPPESAGEEKSQRNSTDSSTSMDVSSFGDSPTLPCEVPQLAEERELPLTNPDEGKMFVPVVCV